MVFNAVMVFRTWFLLQVLFPNHFVQAEKPSSTLGNDHFKSLLRHHFTDEYFNTMYDKLYTDNSVERDSFTNEDRKRVFDLGDHLTDHVGNELSHEKADFEHSFLQEVRSVQSAIGSTMKSENLASSTLSITEDLQAREETPFDDIWDSNVSEDISRLEANKYTPWSDVGLVSLDQFPEPDISDEIAEVIPGGAFSSPINPISSKSPQNPQNLRTGPPGHNRVITADNPVLSFARKRSACVNEEASDESSRDLEIQRRINSFPIEQPVEFFEGDEPKNSTAPPEPESVRNSRNQRFQSWKLEEERYPPSFYNPLHMQRHRKLKRRGNQQFWEPTSFHSEKGFLAYEKQLYQSYRAPRTEPDSLFPSYPVIWKQKVVPPQSGQV